MQEFLKELEIAMESDADIHFQKSKGKGVVEASGHPASVMVALEQGVAITIKGIAESGQLGSEKRELFELFVKGVRESLEL